MFKLSVLPMGITLLAGMGIPIMASLNSSLGAKLGHPVNASIILFVVAFTLTVTFAFGSKTSLNLSLDKLPFYYYMGGFFVAFYVLSITWSAPILGISTAIFLVLMGQVFASIVIEHYGFFNAKQVSLSPLRFAGVCFMVLGIVLARRGV